MKNLLSYYSDMNITALDWNAIRVFASVAEHGTLSAAAEELGISQPTAGRQVGKLEAALDLRLFKHHRTGYALTDEGRKLLELARRMRLDAAEFERAASLASSSRRSPRIRIALGDWSLHFLAPRLSDLVSGNPELQIEIVAEDRFTDLSRNEADLAVRNQRPRHHHLIAKKIGTTASYVYGSESYCRSRPSAFDPDRWPEHDWVGFGTTRPEFSGTRWLGALLGGKSPRYVVNRSSGVLAAIHSGCALGTLPAWIGAFEGLVRVSDRPVRTGELWLTYHGDLRADPILRDVKDRLQSAFLDRLRETADLLPGLNS